MEPANFEESNHSLDPPPGRPDVHPLFVHRHLEVVVGSDNKHSCGPGTEVISCWKPTRAELDEINRTGRVWVRVSGVTMPPIIVTGHYPFERRGGET